MFALLGTSQTFLSSQVAPKVRDVGLPHTGLSLAPSLFIVRVLRQSVREQVYLKNTFCRKYKEDWLHGHNHLAVSINIWSLGTFCFRNWRCSATATATARKPYSMCDYVCHQKQILYSRLSWPLEDQFLPNLQIQGAKWKQYKFCTKLQCAMSKVSRPGSLLARQFRSNSIFSLFLM